MLFHVIQQECARAGFNLVHPFQTKWYNDLIVKEGLVDNSTLKQISSPSCIPFTMEKNGSIDSYRGCNAMLVGNSKALWEKFIQWLAQRVQQQSWDQVLNNHPLDTFVTESLSNLIHSSCVKYAKGDIASYEFYWSNGTHYINQIDAQQELALHQHPQQDYHCKLTHSDKFLVSMQRVAKVTGKYWHDDQGTKLCVHPQLGTWTAFRAVIVFHPTAKHLNRQQDSRIPPPPPLCICPVSQQEVDNARKFMDLAIRMTAGDDTTGGMLYTEANSEEAKKMCTRLHNSVSSGSDWAHVSPSMRLWIQLRDCISVGRQLHKYGDAQLLYHYTKDPEILRAQVMELNRKE